MSDRTLQIAWIKLIYIFFWFVNEKRLIKRKKNIFQTNPAMAVLPFTGRCLFCSINPVSSHFSISQKGFDWFTSANRLWSCQCSGVGGSGKLITFQKTARILIKKGTQCRAMLQRVVQSQGNWRHVICRSDLKTRSHNAKEHRRGLLPLENRKPTGFT